MEDETRELIIKRLCRKMEGKTTLEDFIMSKIFEFIMATSEENLRIIEYWIKRARDIRRELKEGSAWHR